MVPPLLLELGQRLIKNLLLLALFEADFGLLLTLPPVHIGTLTILNDIFETILDGHSGCGRPLP